jgi:hypothetical protein
MHVALLQDIEGREKRLLVLSYIGGRPSTGLHGLVLLGSSPPLDGTCRTATAS